MEISESLGIAEVRPSPHRAIVATVIGNGLEWFDFTVYSYFAVILAKVFFPDRKRFQFAAACGRDIRRRVFHASDRRHRAGCLRGQ